MAKQEPERDASLHGTSANLSRRDDQQKPDQSETPGARHLNDPGVQEEYDALDQPDTDPDDDQYGNLDEPDEDLYGNLEDLEMVQDADPDIAASDQYGSQNPIGSSNEPDTPGGQGLYDVQDQYGQDREIVRPGSERDQYGTRGSQDQYGDQQNIEPKNRD